MAQSRTWSLIESFAQPFTGLMISWCITMIVFPLYGYTISKGAAFSMNCIFFCASFIRSYFIRRLFNLLTPT